MSIIPIVDKIRSLSIVVETNQSTNIGDKTGEFSQPSGDGGES